MTTIGEQSTTDLEWTDLVLPADTLGDVREIVEWLKRPARDSGYRALFDGPSGTGKTLTAALMGKEVGADVYSLDLSSVVSKYIGETEKNLSALFDRGEEADWILFFDEADALFGKRTSVKDSHDRYANQETSYLLERIEDYSGLVILATNLRDRLDDAVRKRVQSVVHFPLPDEELRRRLWSCVLDRCGLGAADVDLTALARRFTLSGRAIDAVARSTAEAVRVDRRGSITQADLVAVAEAGDDTVG